MKYKALVVFMLFNKQRDVELEFENNPSLDEVKNLLFNKLHEAKNKEGEVITADVVDEKVFMTIQLLEVQVQKKEGGQMTIYKWKQATMLNSKFKYVDCSNYGAFIMTKQII